MALTRKFLSALGIEADKVDEIISAHAETVEGLKEQIAQFKADAEQLPKVKEELEKAKEAAKDGGDAAKIQKAFDEFKQQVETERTKAAKETALRKIAKDAGLTEAGITKALKYSDYDKLELNDKGDFKDASTLLKSLKEEWAEYISTEEKHGADVPNPPPGNKPDYDSMSDADYYKATYEANKKGK